MTNTNPPAAAEHQLPGFFDDLTDEWTEVLVLPTSAAAQLPPNAHLFRRRTPDGGGLSCLVGGGVTIGYSLQVTYVARPRLADAIGADAPIHRPPTTAELVECVNRFTPAGNAFALVFISENVTAYQWPAAVPLRLMQLQAQPARSLNGKGVQS